MPRAARPAIEETPEERELLLSGVPSRDGGRRCPTRTAAFSLTRSDELLLNVRNVCVAGAVPFCAVTRAVCVAVVGRVFTCESSAMIACLAPSERAVPCAICETRGVCVAGVGESSPMIAFFALQSAG